MSDNLFTVKEYIFETIENMVVDFLLLLKKEKIGNIEQLIRDGVLTPEDLVDHFRKALKSGLVNIDL